MEKIHDDVEHSQSRKSACPHRITHLSLKITYFDLFKACQMIPTILLYIKEQPNLRHQKLSKI